MDINTAIFGRHCLGNLLADPVAQDLIEELLNSACQAPNHFKVRPWRFIVLRNEAREALGSVMAESHARKNPQATAEQLATERARPLRAPVLIAVGVDLPAEERVLLQENICAAAAATQNLLLAAHARGLGAIWRTGPAAADPEVKKFLGLNPEQPLIAFVYLGWPAIPIPDTVRPGFNDRVTWLGGESC